MSGELASILCAFLWAVALVIFRAGGRHVGPVALNLFKNIVGLLLFAISLVVLAWWRGHELAQVFLPAELAWQQYLALFLSGGIGIGIADTILFASLNRLGAGRHAIVEVLYSPFVVLCSAIYLSEPLEWTLFAGLAVMIAAILLGTYRYAAISGPAEKARVVSGVVLGVIASALMAIGIVIAKPALDISDPWWANLVRLLGGIVLLTPQIWWRGQRRDVLYALSPGRHWRVLVPGAVVGTYLAIFFWILGMKLTYTTVASVLNMSAALFVIVLAALFLKEPLTWRKAAAVLLGLIGGALVVL